jgi:pterin-4a-carbinolamine dehydratase
MSCQSNFPYAEKWDFRNKPCQMTRKFQFSAYRETRDFLDYLNTQVEEIGTHPSTINFSTTFASIIIDGDEGSFLPEQLVLAEKISEFYQLTFAK